MILNVRVIPRAKQNRIQSMGSGFKIYVTKPAQDNKANLAVIEVLSRHFNVGKNRINIIRGGHSRDKAIEIV